ncbi:AraC family transcriptional regulator [Actinacidiphila glaucinigra]|uniref:AraC family transcriptional regulator n=1 Tax=Actinacidiphila glaucinigra TaxID=235986 RepID=UPI002DD7E959|nr:AraC family transcriptional regulator [Actinacidiphila glaucinigra]WSD57850.1 AraC family transcriptional regulator [Actinacidiphila glaucinigra]
MSDELAAVFDLLEVNGVISAGFTVGGRWRTRFRPQVHLKLLTVARGGVRVSVNHEAVSLRVGVGDVVVLNGCESVLIEDDLESGGLQTSFTHPADQAFFDAGGGDDTVVVGGHIDLAEGAESLVAGLGGPLLRLPAGTDTARLTGILNHLLDEARSARLASEPAGRLHARLVILEILRAAVQEGESVPAGWARGLLDDGIRPALRAMHDDPGHPWGLEELARRSAMSRTVFAERFVSVVGKPPLTYLTGWRMYVARRALRQGDVRVDELALRLGYSTASAFSTAFRRETGASPRTYRSLYAGTVPAV